MPIPVRSRRYDERYYAYMKNCSSDRKGFTTVSENYGMEDANDDLF
jgi:predicted anti-sigma-YlaC factor YlaD